MDGHATLWDLRLSRNTDPQSSHDAAVKVNASGKRDAQCGAVLRALANHPGSTSMELAHFMGIERSITGRRLPDLEQQGKVKRGDLRPCSICKTKCVTWYAKKKEENT